MNDQEQRRIPHPNQFALVCVVVELVLVPLAWLVEFLWPPQKFSLTLSIDALSISALGAVPPVALLLCSCRRASESSGLCGRSGRLFARQPDQPFPG